MRHDRVLSFGVADRLDCSVPHAPLGLRMAAQIRCGALTTLILQTKNLTLMIQREASVFD